MKEMILLILGFVLINNYALSAGLGLVPLLGFSSQRGRILTLGLSVTVVTLLVSVLLWLLRGVIPAYFTILATVVLVLVLLYLLQLVCVYSRSIAIKNLHLRNSLFRSDLL